MSNSDALNVVDSDSHGFDRLCVDCGYDMRGLDSLRCPECGRIHTDLELDQSAHYRVITERRIEKTVIWPLSAFVLFAMITHVCFEVGIHDLGVLAAVPCVAIATIGFPISIVQTACLSTQLEIVGRPKPSAFHLHLIPAYATLMWNLLVYTFAFFVLGLVALATAVVVGSILLATLEAITASFL